VQEFIHFYFASCLSLFSCPVYPIEKYSKGADGQKILPYFTTTINIFIIFFHEGRPGKTGRNKCFWSLLGADNIGHNFGILKQ
jgi:hypothetical protein